MGKIVDTLLVLLLVSILSSIGAQAFANAKRDTAVIGEIPVQYDVDGYVHGPHCMDSRVF